MALRIDLPRMLEIWRYYQAGIVNTLFGLGLFALLLRLGFNMYAAQLIAHVIGMAFNYLSYSRHVFRDAAPAKLRFILSYAANYLAGVTTLWIVAHIIPSPYLAGFLASLLVSLVNYFALKYLVFGKAAE